MLPGNPPQDLSARLKPAKCAGRMNGSEPLCGARTDAGTVEVGREPKPAHTGAGGGGWGRGSPWICVGRACLSPNALGLNKARTLGLHCPASCPHSSSLKRRRGRNSEGAPHAQLQIYGFNKRGLFRFSGSG